RALRFARGDETPLPGFEENEYAPAGEFGARTLVDLADELRAVRAATVTLFAGLPAQAWERSGIANDRRLTVAILAWGIAGHELHHRHLLETRYLSPAPLE
ncbi:MAG: DinB family protein, partial [Longimicrobiales bacterium]